MTQKNADKKESLSDSASPREAYLWDGLALLQKGNERYAVEPHASGGTPFTAENRQPATDNHASSVLITDYLGTTLGTVTGETFTATRLTAFGERITTEVTENTGVQEILSAVSSSNTENRQPGTDNHASSVFYTGKHYDSDLEAYNFLFRNYQPGTSRWTAADPSGFPDGANNWVYVNNGVMRKMDPLGLRYIVPGPNRFFPNDTTVPDVWQYSQTETKSMLLADITGDKDALNVAKMLKSLLDKGKGGGVGALKTYGEIGKKIYDEYVKYQNEINAKYPPGSYVVGNPTTPNPSTITVPHQAAVIDFEQNLDSITFNIEIDPFSTSAQIKFTAVILSHQEWVWE